MIGKQIRAFSKNEVIFHEGEAGQCAYLIESGRVLVYLMKDGLEISLKILGKGEIFGEMSMIDNRVRSASCRALTEVRLVTVTQEQLLDRIQSADPIVRLLMRALLDRLRIQTDSIRGKPVLENVVVSENIEEEKKEALERISLENRMASALEKDEFVPYYQPIYDLETEEVRGCEALLRWRQADGSIVAPGQFIDALEESPLILDVGLRMIEKCLADMVKMQAAFSFGEDFFVSVNVSGRQFSDPDFLKHLEGAREPTGIHAHHFKLEVTERIMAEGPMAISTLERCHSLGYKIAIDDFGTGFSSLQYLAAMPLNDLKVDRSFIKQMMIDEKSFSIVKTLVYLANLLNLNLIAEGIETSHQLALLRKMRIPLGQGFLFAKALPYEEFVALVTKTPLKKAA